MNKSLRQLFTIVVALFVILGMSTTIIMAIRANQLTNDARNVRALYHEYGAPRGSILAADGSVIAKSDPSNDSFSYQRSYSAGELYAPVTGFFSISQRGWSGVEASRARCCRASRSSCSGSGSSRCSPGRRTRAPISKRPSIRRFSRPHTTASAARMAPQWPSSRKPAVSSPWSARPATTRTSWPAMT